MTHNRIIVDGDPIAYSAGAGAETRTHDIIYTDKDGKYGRVFLEEDPREWVKQLKKDGGEIIERELIITPKPWEFAAMLTRSVVHGIQRHTAKVLGVPFEDCQWELILSGKGNFRNDVATVQEYKGSRVGKLKPHWFKNIRQYLLDSFSGELVNGIEADDEVCIRMNEAREWGDNAILATIDKDLDQVVGMHWDYKKKVAYDITAEDAVFLLYSQILSGDPTDDIPGAKGIGPGRAAKLINHWIEQFNDDPIAVTGDLESWLWQNVVKEYSQRGVKGAAEDSSPEALALEMARLVNLQDHRGQLWTPPGAPEETI